MAAPVNYTGLEVEEGVVPQVVENRSWGRGKIFGATLLTVGAIVAVVAPLWGGEAEWEEYIPGSHPGFINYDAIPVHPRLLASETQFPALCNKAVVARSCKVMNENTKQNFYSKYDNSTDYVHALEISELFMADPDDVKRTFSRLGLKNWGQNFTDGRFAVSCKELCDKLVSSYPPQQVPGLSYVGCFPNPETGKSDCSVDVSPEELAKIGFGIPLAAKEGAYDEVPAMDKFLEGTEGPLKQVQEALAAGKPESVKESLLHGRGEGGLTYTSMSWNALRMDILNMFRVFPIIDSKVQRNTDLKAAFGQTPNEPPAVGRRLGLNAQGQEQGHAAGSDWRATTLAASVKAKAYVSAALSKLASREIPHLVTMWFGNNNETPTRDAIIRVLSGVQSMLGNVDYVYPGLQCGPNVYAYVFPQPPWNKVVNMEDGKVGSKFVYHLCDYYMGVNEGEKIETLTHEGSHHLMQATTDAKSTIDGTTMYGRGSCKAVAQSCALGDNLACDAARTNADTFCYFINDAALSNSVQQEVTESAKGAEQGAGGAVPANTYASYDSATAAKTGGFSLR